MHKPPSQPDHWSSLAGLERLRERLSGCVPWMPGFVSLSLFGSLAEGRADGYSDLDVVVATEDFPTARERALRVLEAGLGALESCWVVSLHPQEWNPTLVFTGEGYYHKVDFGLVASDAEGRTIPAAQTIEVVCRVGEPPPVVGPRSQAYAPAEGSVGHFLLGQLLGGVRYVKARRRGQPLSAHRFVAATAEGCFRLLYARLTGAAPAGPGRLSTEEYAALDRGDSEGRGLAILSALDYSTPENMDRSACGLFRQVLELGGDLAGAREETLNTTVLERMLAFMHAELRV